MRNEGCIGAQVQTMKRRNVGREGGREGPTCGGERRTLHWEGLGPGVPYYHLPRIRATGGREEESEEKRKTFQCVCVCVSLRE